MDDLAVDDFLSKLLLFKGKRVLVTGDTGFKGSWLCMWLHELGAEIAGFSLPPISKQDHFCLLSLGKFISHFDGDIRDASAVNQVFEDFQPEFLFHLAAQPLVRLSYEEPKMTFDTNVGGSVNILEAVRKSKSLRSVIYVTSDKCYRNKEWIWGYRENDELGGYDPYSASKAAAEIVLSAYIDSFFSKNNELGIASVRAGNVIGGGDWALDRIIPDSIRALERKEAICLRNPNSTRPWQHVLEPLGGYLLLAANLFENPSKFSGAWNFGPAAASVQTVLNLATRVVEVWGNGTVKLNCAANDMHEARILKLNCDKAHQLLKWKPRWDFDYTVKQTVEWYKKIWQGEAAQTITRNQIKLYMKSGKV